jgi:hypothetical protein
MKLKSDCSPAMTAWVVCLRSTGEAKLWIGAPSYFDARKLALMNLPQTNPEDLDVMPAPDESDVDVAGYWTGTDAGSHPNRQFIVLEAEKLEESSAQ